MTVANLSTGVGALVLGIGLGALLSDFLQVVAWPVLVIGVVMHAWGMFDKHRLESGGAAAQVWWETALYWICWISLAILALVVIVRFS